MAICFVDCKQMINFAPKIYFGMETRLEIIMMEEAKICSWLTKVCDEESILQYPQNCRR